MRAVPGAIRRHAGFTLAEVLVALFIVSALAAVTIPTVFGRVRTANTTAVINELQTLRDAVSSYRQHVGRYPNRLRYLTLLPTSGVTDLCGTAYTSVQYGAWRGPYVTRTITDLYVIADADTVDNIIGRSPTAATANVSNYLIVYINGVDQAMATDLQTRLDGDNNFAAGAIVWSNGQLEYRIPVAGNGTSGC